MEGGFKCPKMGVNFSEPHVLSKKKVTDFFLKWRFQSDKIGVFWAPVSKKITVKRALPVIEFKFWSEFKRVSGMG
jgi:hypothetical protein